MTHFSDIIGYDAQKEELKRICDTLKNPEKYKSTGAVTPRSILIYGDPGLGKTLMAKALIDESGRKCFVCRKNRPDRDFVDDIRKTFEKAVSEAPSIIFLDDMDKFAEDNLRSDSNKEEYATIQSCFEDLGDSEVFIVATANDIDIIPESLLRPGRFGNKMLIEQPSFEDCVRITEGFLKTISVSENVTPEFVASLLRNKTGAEIEEVINEAVVYSTSNGNNAISKDDVIRATMNTVYHVKANSLGKSDQHNNDLKRIVAYHEAGHAVTAWACGKHFEIVSICNTDESEGFCDCGHGEANTFDQIEKSIIVDLGGMASVNTILGIKDAGTASDIEHASYLLRTCAEKLLSFGLKYRNDDINRYDELRFSPKRQDSTSKKISAQMKKYYRKSQKIIRKNRSIIESVVSELKLNHYLSYADFEKIVSNKT